jgi:hypothetical protein
MPRMLQGHAEYRLMDQGVPACFTEARVSRVNYGIVDIQIFDAAAGRRFLVEGWYCTAE